MATHSSILAWRIPWTEELGGLQSTGRKESDTTERLHYYHYPNLYSSMSLIPEKVSSIIYSIYDNGKIFPLTGSLFMLFAVLLFGPCIFNAITQFITSWIESIKLQMVIAQ